MPALNLWSDISGIANAMLENAYFAIRENYSLQSLVSMYGDMAGLNPRRFFSYNLTAAVTIAESDDLSSTAFTPAAGVTLTPAEIGEQFFVTDSRRDSNAPENIIRDGALELGRAGGDKIQTDLVTAIASLTGGTVGTAGTTITWGYLAAAIARARNANKSNGVQLNAVMHGYQWAALAKTASVAGAAVGTAAPNFADLITKTGFAAEFMGVPIYQVFGGVDTNDDFTGGVFPRNAIALDMRRAIRIEAERDASRRGTEFNMSALYAVGAVLPTLGVKFIFDASAPSS